MAEIVVFGTGAIAELAHYYFEADSPHQVVAFTADRDYIQQDLFERKPVLPFEDIEKRYPPERYLMFVALSYARMNKVREEKYHDAKGKGYQLTSYISTRCNYLSGNKPGDNCFILEDNTIQPFVSIGDNVTLWSGNHIGHHSTIHPNNFISSHVVISGHCTIEPNCFLGVNATLAHHVVLARETLVGAGAVISKHTEKKGVYVAPRSVKLERTSDTVKL